MKQTSFASAVLAGLIFFTGCSVVEDRGDARLVAARVHAEMMAGDLANIYRESAPRFRSVGSESEFVAMMQKYDGEFGSFKSANEIGYKTTLDSRIGRTHELLFDLEYERVRARELLIMVRSAKGKMELWKLDIQRLD
jgi:hypothetical protein